MSQTDEKPRAFEDTLLRPRERVLSTLNADGSRRWLRLRLAKGRFWNARRALAYVLIAVFTLVPFLTINDQPAILLDVVNRRFHLLGATFLPTDTRLLVLLILTAFLGIFAFTAIFGRVFCGWACPQTVWLEFLYRPVERIFLGTAGRGGKPTKPVPVWRYAAMYFVFFLLSIHLAHTLLSYFVGVQALNQWIWSSTPWQHPAAFLVVTLVTAWMMWDMAFWREQMCIIGCPYGRFQSALLDRNTVIVAYDRQRGEPRSRARGKCLSLAVADNARSCTGCKDCRSCGSADRLQPAASPGDCVDCTMCVQVCPTGIDIRDGLQSECVNCTQCIDACDAVMDKLHRPRGLIAYRSQSAAEGQPSRFLRPRVVIYPTLLAVVASALIYLLLTRPSFDFVVLRPAGGNFERIGDAHVLNRLAFKLTNRAAELQQYTMSIVDRDDVFITTQSPTITREPLVMELENVRLSAPAAAFNRGELVVTVRVTASDRSFQDRPVVLRGPFSF